MGRKKILVVDDEPAVREVIRATIERMAEDIEIVLVKDGGEALNRIMDNSYDLIITDVRMPVLDGVRLSMVVRALGKDLEIIWISGYGFHDLLEDIETLGIFSFMVKPVKVGEIRNNVQAALGLTLSG